MKFFLLLTLISASAFSKEMTFNAFKVDTSITDLKPVEAPAPAKLATVNFIKITDEKSAYNPSSYKPMINPFGRQFDNFTANEQEKRNQSARGISAQ